MNASSIDIIIPSFRADPKYLIPIFNLDKPEDVEVRYFLILDNPEIKICDTLKELIEHDNIFVIQNETNLGASASRNKGIEEGTGDWLLFLDDDVTVNRDLLIKYINAITESESKVPGFVGVTEFPDSINSFTKGVNASDILTFFPLAEDEEEMTWGVTANLLFKREAVGNFRFQDEIFPKFGGGEDIDLCLNIVQQTGNRFKTIPEAKVAHPWWNDGKRSYTRFKRWAYGDSILPKFFPQYKYYNFPNVIESLILFVVLGIALSVLKLSPIPLFLCLGSVILGEILIEWMKIIKNKKIYSLITVLESVLIRTSNDLGRALGNIKRLNITGFMQRFDYFCDGKHIKNERIWAGLKTLSYSFFTFIFVYSFWVLC